MDNNKTIKKFVEEQNKLHKRSISTEALHNGESGKVERIQYLISIRELAAILDKNPFSSKQP